MHVILGKKIQKQQSCKLDKTIEGQKEKKNREAKRIFTKGNPCHYQIYVSIAKQTHNSGRFTFERTKEVFRLLREQSQR